MNSFFVALYVLWAFCRMSIPLSKRCFQCLNVFCNDLDPLKYVAFLESLYL